MQNDAILPKEKKKKKKKDFYKTTSAKLNNITQPMISIKTNLIQPIGIVFVELGN